MAVLAFPTPRGQRRIADIDEKALYYRAPYSSQPGVKPFLPAPADYPPLPADQCIPSKAIVDLTAKLAPDGRLVWDVPRGQLDDHAVRPNDHRADHVGRAPAPGWDLSATSSTRPPSTRISMRSSRRC